MAKPMLLLITALLVARLSTVTGNESTQLVKDEERGGWTDKFGTWTWDGCLIFPNRNCVAMQKIGSEYFNCPVSVHQIGKFGDTFKIFKQGYTGWWCKIGVIPAVDYCCPRNVTG